MHLLSILFSSLPSHVFSGNPILHNIFSLFQQCSAVQWFGQCSRMPVCLVFYYVVYGRPCPLLLYVLHVLRWQKIQNSVCFYLPYSFLYSSVRNYKHNYMVIMPIIVILFFDDVVYEWPLPSTSVSRMVFRRWLPPVLVLWVPLSVHTKAFSSSSVSR